MIRITGLVATCIFFVFENINAQIDSFYHQPWKNANFPILIDAYQENRINFNTLSSDKRVKGIIHKASQGFVADQKYIERKRQASAMNLLFASYHLGTHEDPVQQADFYLQIIKEHPNDPMVLDIEDFQYKQHGKGYMPLENAEKFILRIYEMTGRYPFIYVNNYVFKEINEKYDTLSVFAKCPLWYARFIPQLPVLSDKVWPSVALWQFSSEINCKETGKCLYNVPGTAFDIDVNVFQGTEKELKALWKSKSAHKKNIKNQKTEPLEEF